jgi:multidrug efflux pump subunit AcrA (membrane-fusion protein)
VVARAGARARGHRARADGIRSAEEAGLAERGAAANAAREADSAALDLKLAEVEAEIARIDVEAAELRLEQTKVVSPLSGMVTEIFLEPGGVVDGPGVPIVQVGTAYLRFLSPESGAECVDLDDRVLALTLESVVPVLRPEESRPQLRVTAWIDSSPDRPLFPGLKVWLRLPKPDGD